MCSEMSSMIEDDKGLMIHRAERRINIFKNCSQYTRYSPTGEP
jgi:hypothetical protein